MPVYFRQKNRHVGKFDNFQKVVKSDSHRGNPASQSKDHMAQDAIIPTIKKQLGLGQGGGYRYATDIAPAPGC